MSTINLSDLSAADKKKLRKQIEQEMRAEENQLKQIRTSYKAKVDKVVPKLFKRLQEASDKLSKVKTEVYEALEGLIVQKNEAYQANKEQDYEQQSHSFTSLDGKQTIIIGYRINDDWDDTVEVGIAKVKEFITAMGTDENSRDLVDTVLQLLNKDAKGNLKASRVLQLQKLAEKNKNPLFKDAMKIIAEAHRPKRTRQFVTVRYKDDQGNSIELPLSITDAHIALKQQEETGK